MRIAVITPPSSLVSLALTKKHLRVDFDDDDELITAYVAAACGHIDGPGAYLGRPIGAQVLELRDVAFPSAAYMLALPFGPALEIVSIKYRNVLGVDTTMAPETYGLDGLDIAPVGGVSWPTTDQTPAAIKVRWRAGYEATPPAIVAAVLLMTGDLYANRETAVVGLTASGIPMSTTVENLLRPFRVLEV